MVVEGLDQFWGQQKNILKSDDLAVGNLSLEHLLEAQQFLFSEFVFFGRSKSTDWLNK